MHPVFQQIINTLPHRPPVICRRCDEIIAGPHTLADCEDAQQQAVILAREKRAQTAASATLEQVIFNALSDLKTIAPDGMHWDAYAAREIAHTLTQKEPA